VARCFALLASWHCNFSCVSYAKDSFAVKEKITFKRFSFPNSLYGDSTLARLGGAADKTIIPAMIGKHINKIIAGTRVPKMS